MNKLIKRSLVSVLALSVVGGTFSTNASADVKEIRASVEVEEGNLTLSEIGNLTFEIFELSNLVDFEKTVAIGTTEIPDSFIVTDSTGTAGGWNLNVSAEVLSQKNADDEPINPLEGALSITAPTTVAAGETSSGFGGTETNAGIDTDFGLIDNGTGVKLMKADAGKGIGEFTATGSELKIDADYEKVREGTYTSTVKFNLMHGPDATGGSDGVEPVVDPT